MNKITTQSLIICSIILPFNLYADSSTHTENLAGIYNCIGYDKKDKALSQKLTITLDEKNSMLENGYGAYTFKAEVPPTVKVKDLPPNIVVTGAIASSGNIFSMSFQNTNAKAAADYGTVIGISAYTQDKNGTGQTILHLFSYQPAYKGGDTSLWTCLKLNLRV